MTTAESQSKHLPLVSASQASVIRIQRRSEWRFVAGLCALVLLLTSAPYVFASVKTPPGKHYMGLMLDVPDHIQYFSWMRDLSTANLAADRLTPEPNEPAYFNLLWWGLGRIGSVTGLDYAALYTLLRMAAVLVGLGCAYAFLRIVIPEQGQRRVAFVLIAFGSGLGIVWIALKYLLRLPEAPFPFDTYTAEPNTFLTLLGYPHFALALGLIVATFGLILVALREKRLRYAVAAGIVALILGLQHTYDLVTVYAVLGLFGVLMWLRDRQFPRFLFVSGLIVVGISVPPAAYSVLLVNASPIWGKVLAQFDNAGAFTPNPLHLPVLLGIPFLLALFAFRPRALQSRSDTEMFVGAWFVSHFVLAYLPIDFQIHLLNGWQIPIAILAASALVSRIGPSLANRARIRPRTVVAGVIALALMTNLYVLTWRFVELRRYASPYYLTTDEIAALDWLSGHTTSQDVVLSTLDFGQYVPMWSDARAFLAHWTGTVDFQGKTEMVNTVLSSDASDAERLAILNEFGVSYVVSRLQDRQSATFAQADPPYLIPVFTQGQVTVYRTQTAPQALIIPMSLAWSDPIVIWRQPEIET